MPWPENCDDGIFWGRNTRGDMIYDLGPREFSDTITAEGLGDDLKFFFAGAVHDLLKNGDDEQAGKYLEAARERFPDSPWDKIPAIAQGADQPAERVDGLSGAYTTIQRLFEAAWRL